MGGVLPPDPLFAPQRYRSPFSFDFDPRPAPPPDPYGGATVGTQFTGPRLTNPSPDFDPAVDPSIARWPGRPITESEYEGLRQGSIGTFADLASMDTGGSPFGLPRSVMLASRRIPKTPVPRDIGGGQRGMMAMPSLRSMTPEQASAVASQPGPTGMGPHIIPKPSGEGYVGAPDWVKTPEHIQKMRDDFDEAVDRGVEGRDWYKNQRAWITSVTDPNDPTAPRRMAEGLGIFSPQSDPDTNLQFYLQAQNARLRGQPLPLVRTGQQAQSFNEGMAAREAARAAGLPEPDIVRGLGKKTAPFAWHLSPDRPYGTTGVNDIWHARSFGYTNPDGTEFDGSPTEQQHMFMDYETVRAIDRANARAAGGFTDWDAANVQAAPWVANKERALRAQFKNWTPEQIHQKALKSFSDYSSGLTAYMPHEQVPGASTGLYDLLPESQRTPFSLAATWRDPQTGHDLLVRGLGLHQPPMADTPGTYINSRGELETNPTQTAQPLIDYEANVEPRRVHPGTATALTSTSYLRGLIDAQEGTPWGLIDTRGSQPKRDLTSLRLTGVRPTPEQLNALQPIASKNGFFVSDTGDGVSLIHGGMDASPANGSDLAKRLKGGLSDEIQQVLPGATITPGRHLGVYADLSSELARSVAGQGQATEKVLGEMAKMREAAPGMYDRMLANPAIATKAQANLARLTPEMQAARPDYVRLLKIMAKGGLPGLMGRVAKTGAAGLPAALLALQGQDEGR